MSGLRPGDGIRQRTVTQGRNQTCGWVCTRDQVGSSRERTATQVRAPIRTVTAGPLHGLGRRDCCVWWALLHSEAARPFMQPPPSCSENQRHAHQPGPPSGPVGRVPDHRWEARPTSSFAALQDGLISQWETTRYTKKSTAARGGQLGIERPEEAVKVQRAGRAQVGPPDTRCASRSRLCCLSAV